MQWLNGIPVLGLRILRDAAPLCVLVVETLELHQLTVATLASQSGASPRLALNDAEAVYLAGAQDFDLILLDADKSLMAAVVTAAKIRAIEREKPIKHRAAVVACTSSASNYNDCLCCLDHCSGLSGVVWRPGDVDALSTCIELWCSGKFSAPPRSGRKEDDTHGGPKLLTATIAPLSPTLLGHSTASTEA